MINISNISNKSPYIKFKCLYKEALAAEQSNIEAICISSFDYENKESNSRFVNLKYIIDDEWIFLDPVEYICDCKGDVCTKYVGHEYNWREGKHRIQLK